MPRPRTQKGIAKRIELQYFKRLHPFRRWKLVLTIAAPAIAAVWLIALAATGDQRIYSSGPVSTSHAMFGVHCAQCHNPAFVIAVRDARAGKSYWLRVTDKACLRCHDGPVHHDTQTFRPECDACHVEHKGHVVLAFMNSQHCTRCHADLLTKGPATPFARSIHTFSSGHPEFAVLVRENNQTSRIRLDDKARLKDSAQVKLNHQKHLKPGLKGLDILKARRGMKGLIEGPQGLQLTCSYCHQPDGWRAYMAPIVYTKHCDLACHPLDFDASLPEAIAPHDRPAIVHAFLREVFTGTLEECQALKNKENQAGGRAVEDLKKRCQDLELIKVEEEEERPRGRAARREEPAEPSSPEQWVAAQMQSAEAVLFKQKEQKCQLCHMLTFVPEKLPEVAPTAIPIRWLPHSRFDHGAHRMLACTECHKAAESKETTDVLLPSITTCRNCHRDTGSARSGCVECHLYHDKAKDRDLNGPFTIRELVRAAPSSAVPAPVRPGG
ncbi:MAG: hypothetical protein HY278_10865 [candidate division NC10 bacterium]|nr:hypothetical protein [candidate division NC10 bacterium]